MVAQGTAAPGGEPGPGQADRQRNQRARACRAWRRRLVIVLSGVLVLAIDAGAWAASGRPGGQVNYGHPAAGALPVHHRGPGHRPGLVVLASGGLLIPSPPPRPRGQSRGVRVTVEASGDLLIHSPIFDRALALGGGRHYDFAPFFVQIRPYIRAVGLALCHVETPMTLAPPAGYPIFNTPPELATAIRQTGWRACSTAATHTLDQGQTGVDDTICALDQAGVAHTGSFSSAAAQATPVVVEYAAVGFDLELWRRHDQHPCASPSLIDCW